MMKEKEVCDAIVRIRNGDGDSNELTIKLIDNYKLQINGLISKSDYLLYNLDADDLRSECVMTLLRAIDTFDLDKNVKFSTYLHKAFTFSIMRYIASNKTVVRLPEVRQKNGEKVPTIIEYSEVDDSDAEHETYAGFVNNTVEDDIINAERRAIIDEAISQLPKEEGEAVEVYMNRQKMAYLDAKEIYGISKREYNNRLKRGLNKLRKNGKIKRLCG